MRFHVTIRAVTGNNADEPVHLGSVKVKADSKEIAQAKAMDDLWDGRLDGTSYPEVEIEEQARYLIVEGWVHIFDGLGERTVRFVYDQETERLEHLQCQHSFKGWMKGTEQHRLDVEDSLKNANAEALENPEDWGFEASDELPAWAV